MESIMVHVDETEFVLDYSSPYYIYNGEKYVSINGEDSEGNIKLIKKDEFDNEMKGLSDLIASTDRLIEKLKALK